MRFKPSIFKPLISQSTPNRLFFQHFQNLKTYISKRDILFTKHSMLNSKLLAPDFNFNIENSFRNSCYLGRKNREFQFLNTNLKTYYKPCVHASFASKSHSLEDEKHPNQKPNLIPNPNQNEINPIIKNTYLNQNQDLNRNKCDKDDPNGLKKSFSKEQTTIVKDVTSELKGGGEEGEVEGEKEDGSNKDEKEKEKKENNMNFKVGSFQHIPNVPQSSEIIFSALRKMKHIKPTKGIMNAAKREKNRAAKQLDFLIKEVSSPLSVFIKKFPNKKNLHNYEHSILELTLGEGNYEMALEKVNNLRKRILNVGNNACAMIGNTTTKKEAEEKFDEGVEKIKKLYDDHCYVVDELKEIAKKLRSLPVIHPQISTLCLVGAPNVGKSSLIKILSTGKPEVCNYPFTTRSISMGHIFLDSYRFQVTDTPGLLLRPEEDRNDIEKLTIAALTHLPTAILYVHDLTENCGMKTKDQYNLYLDIKQKFGHRPWIDVVSKSDLLPNPLNQSNDPYHPHDDSSATYPIQSSHSPIIISNESCTSSSLSISKEIKSIFPSSDMLSDDSMVKNETRSSEELLNQKKEVIDDDIMQNISLEHYALHGPHNSLRVSTETGEGLELLKHHVHVLLMENRSQKAGEIENGEEQDLDMNMKIRSKDKKEVNDDFYFPPLPKEMLRGV